MSSDPISALGRSELPAAQLQRKEASTQAFGSFGQLLLDNLNRVNAMQKESGTLVTNMILGKETDMNRVMAASEKSSVAFETFMAVRGKLLDSYKEVLNYRI